MSERPLIWPPPASELQNLYWKEGLSLARIGRMFNRSPQVVLGYMKSHGIDRRSLSDAMTRYPKAPFRGDDSEREYMRGFRTGDLFIGTHGRCIRATVSTTHPRMLKLMDDLFGRYGRVARSPKFLKTWNTFEWESWVYLHESFDFLLEKPPKLQAPFLDFFAGFFDAEGCIYLGPQKGSTKTNVRLEVANNNLDLLISCREELHKMGYFCTISPRPYHRKGDYAGLARYNRDLWRLALGRKAEVISLLSLLRIRHAERIEKRELVLQYADSPWVEAAPHVHDFRQRLRAEVRESTSAARDAYLARRATRPAPSPVV